MNLKLKENVNVGSFTFQKRVIEEALELIGRKRNYVDNDIKFVTMITFCNNLVEDNLIIESLYKEEDIEAKMETMIEPFFKEQVLDKPEIKEIFNDIVYQIIAYMDREYDSRNYVAGFIYDFMSDMGSLTKEDIEQLIRDFMTIVGIKNNKVISDTIDVEKEQIIDKNVEDLKMKAFIEKFARENKEESTN